jgi:hypothetical protein
MEAAPVRDESRGELDSPPQPPDSPLLSDASDIEAFTLAPEQTVPRAATTACTTSASHSIEPKSAETTTGMQPVVKETLMCSLEGEVLYDWNCTDTEERVALLEFISKRARAMTASLPLGTFERFESVDRGRRCVARVEGDQALFIRVQSVLTASPNPNDTP